MKRKNIEKRLNLSLQKLFAKYTGDIGEKVIERYLELKGFEILDFWRAVEVVETSRRIELGYYKHPAYEEYRDEIYQKVKDFKDFLGEKFNAFKDYLDAWSRDADTPSGKYFQPRPGQTIRVGGRSTGFGFDFIGKKDNQFFMIEVKTNRARLLGYQRKMLIRAKDFGFVPLLIRVNVNIEAPFERIQITKF
ncbi:MAG: hypothetical protein ACE5GD_00355 [Candidatus Geothermarchaeales archaeon]